MAAAAVLAAPVHIRAAGLLSFLVFLNVTMSSSMIIRRQELAHGRFCGFAGKGGGEVVADLSLLI